MEEKGRLDTQPDSSEFAISVQRPTIRDIARVAGVSVSTVSHVLNGYSDIGEDTERRVRLIMEGLNYHPSALARRLVKKRSYSLQLLLFAVEGLRHPFFYEVTCGITAEVDKAGYELVLSARESHDRRWRDTLKRCCESNVEGLLVMGALPTPRVLDDVSASGIPAVMIDIPFEGPRATYVTSDNISGAQIATDHLISLGHDRIAFIDGYNLPEERGSLPSISVARRIGYREALRNHGIDYDSGLICHGDYTQDGARFAVRELLAAHPDVTAIFAISDIMAFGAMKAVRDTGRRIPDDVAVVGFDDIEAASYVRPSLSTIKQQGETMGRSAVCELLRLVANSGVAPKETVLPVELVIRESCGASRQP
ncbi:MAG: LacI family DNA-binding transcriptional regulator [Clostridia bacterium]|nr:LacI family DNA-binding transcriptional regulator [Clostridia bacterium]